MMTDGANLSFWQDAPAPKMTPTKPKKAKGKGKPKYTEEFERDVWGPYPRKNGTSKLNGFKKFEGLDDEDRAALIAAIPVYARQKAGSEECYICHLEFFISRRLFETIAPAKLPPPAGGAPGIEWPRVMSLYARTGNWNIGLGPAPGLPGCRVPKEFLR